MGCHHTWAFSLLFKVARSPQIQNKVHFKCLIYVFVPVVKGYIRREPFQVCGRWPMLYDYFTELSLRTLKVRDDSSCS